MNLTNLSKSLSCTIVMIIYINDKDSLLNSFRSISKPCSLNNCFQPKNLMQECGNDISYSLWLKTFLFWAILNITKPCSFYQGFLQDTRNDSGTWSKSDCPQQIYLC